MSRKISLTSLLVTCMVILALCIGAVITAAQDSGSMDMMGMDGCDTTLVALVWAAQDAYGYQPMMGGDNAGTGGDNADTGGDNAEATQEAKAITAKVEPSAQDATEEPGDNADNEDADNEAAENADNEAAANDMGDMTMAMDCEALRADVVAFVYAQNGMAMGGGTVEMSGDNIFTVQMSGPQEVPGPGDQDAVGTATVSIDSTTGQVCWSWSASGTEPIMAAHIHVGAEGESGDVVVPLMIGDSAPPEGCAMADMAAVESVLANPVGHYVNLHTPSFPAGALRGQLLGS